MVKYIIEGGKKLSGKVIISGNKNAIFPCMSAALLTDEKVVLRNIPDIVDTNVCLDLLKSLGAKVNFKNNVLTIEAKKIRTHILLKDLTQRLRGSVVFAGGLLGRLGKVDFYHPGGDIIGKRSISSHLRGFADLGFNFISEDQHYQIFRKKEHTKNISIFFDEASVTATENIILAAVVGDTTVILKNCAQEPHVVDLCKMLNLMGGSIEGVGSSILKIIGVSKLHSVEFTIGPDYIEMGTFAIAAVITRGNIEIYNCRLDGLEPITIHLAKLGVHLKEINDRVIVEEATLKSLESKLHTNIWPGFPTDMMSCVIVLATQAKGVSLLHDWMFESRMFFVDKLILMGANITIADPHRVLVYGPSRLSGRILETPDIRAGMALLLAALVAKGESVINRAELIERGYEDAVGKFASLGAKIRRVEY